MHRASALHIFASLGASTVALDASDYYVSLERGVVDGEYDSWTSFVGFGMIDLGIASSLFGATRSVRRLAIATIANKDSLAQLSPEQLMPSNRDFKTGTELTMSEFDVRARAVKMPQLPTARKFTQSKARIRRFLCCG